MKDGPMESMSLDGSYTDDAGTEPVTWLIADSTRPGWSGRYEVTTEIRGVAFSGSDFTDLEPDTPSSALTLNAAGEIDNCEVKVRVPTALHGPGDPQAHLSLTFHVGAGTYEPVVDAEIETGQTTASTSQEERLEEVLGALVEQLGEVEWECCLTCGLSDYSPGGNGIMGMRCHRDARSQYLSVQSKMEYWGVPVTEEVPEFYRCDASERRRPGTGYRG
jgi:Family of unknown function (DUF6304)